MCIRMHICLQTGGLIRKHVTLVAEHALLSSTLFDALEWTCFEWDDLGRRAENLDALPICASHVDVLTPADP